MNEELSNIIRSMYLTFLSSNNYDVKSYIIQFFHWLKIEYPNDEIVRTLYSRIMTSLTPKELNLLRINANISDIYQSQYVIDNIDYLEDTIQIDKKGSFKKRNIPLTKELINYILESFLKSVSIELYLFYKNMLHNNHIIFKTMRNKESLGNTFIISADGPETIIFVNKLHNIHDLMVLVHELGHAYYCYLGNIKLEEHLTVKEKIKSEIPSKLLEKLFIQYLWDTCFYYQANQLQKRYDSSMLLERENLENFDNLKYLVGSFLGEKLLEKRKTPIYLENTLLMIKEEDLKTLFEMICKKSSKTKRRSL